MSYGLEVMSYELLSRMVAVMPQSYGPVTIPLFKPLVPPNA